MFAVGMLVSPGIPDLPERHVSRRVRAKNRREPFLYGMREAATADTQALPPNGLYEN